MGKGSEGYCDRRKVLRTGCDYSRDSEELCSGRRLSRGEATPVRHRVRGDPEMVHWEPRFGYEGSPMPARVSRDAGGSRSPSCHKDEEGNGRSSYVGRQFEGRRGRSSKTEGQARRRLSEERGRAKGRKGGQREEKAKLKEKGEGQTGSKEEGSEREEDQGSLLRAYGRSDSRKRRRRRVNPDKLEQQLKRQEVQSRGKETAGGYFFQHRVGPEEKSESEGSPEDQEESQAESEVVKLFVQCEYDKYLQQQGRSDLRGIPQGAENCPSRAGSTSLESLGRHERPATESSRRALRRDPGWGEPPVHGLLPSGASAQGIRRSCARGTQLMLSAGLHPEGTGGPGCRRWVSEIEGSRTSSRRNELVDHTTVGASAPGTRATGFKTGSKRSRSGAISRVASKEPTNKQVGFLDKIRERRNAERRRQSEREEQRERKDERQVLQRRRQEREEVRREEMKRGFSFEKLGIAREEKRGVMGEKISLADELEDLRSPGGSDSALRDAACTDSEVPLFTIGAVVDSIRHQTALSEKELGTLTGRSFGDVVPGLVLGLSNFHEELCKTLPTGDEVLPLPLDTPWNLAEVQNTPVDVQWILLGLICGLNSLNGQGLRWEGTLSQSQKRILLNLLDEAKRFQEFGSSVKFDVCSWDDFLKVRSIDYKGDEVQVAQYTSWKNLAPALPDEIGTVKLENVMERGARRYALNFEAFLMPKDAQHYTKPPRVMIEDGRWEEVCKGLLNKGVCELLGASKVYKVDGKPLLNGLFGVSKNDVVDGAEVHRLIMNLVPLNKLCRSFEGDVGTLPAWPSMAPLSLQPTEDLLISSEDVRCFFYIFEIPVVWRPYMAFNKVVPASLCGEAQEPMYLCARVLPMGFRNSVALAQHIHRWIVGQSMIPRPVEEVMGGQAEHRRDRAFTNSNPSYRVYLDNYDELVKVDSSMAELIAGTPSVHTLALRDTYKDLNIPRHPKKAVAREFVAEVQGALVDGKQGIARPKPDKVGKYIGLAWQLLQEGRCTQKQLQVVAGGLVYMTMFRRPLLGSLNAIWEAIEDFNRSPYIVRREMPMGVKKELLRFCCLVPLARMDFRTPMQACVTASDASTYGGGLTASSRVTDWGGIAANCKVRGDVVEEPDVITVLTIGLFDGIGALRVAADAIGLPVAGHISVEAHEPSRRVVESHFPTSIIVNRVEDVSDEMVLEWSCRFSQVGLVVLGAGPPCQGVSGLNVDRKGALKDKRSCLFEHVERIYNLVRQHFPWAQVHKLMESVASMDSADRVTMSMGVELTPWLIDSSGLTLCRRPRLYWFTWELRLGPGVDVGQAEGTGWEEIKNVKLQVELNPRLWLTPGWSLVGEKLPTFTTARPRPEPGRRPAGLEGCNEREIRRWKEDSHRFPPYQYRSTNCLVNNRGEHRIPNIQEREVMMGFPMDYTRNCLPKAAQGKQSHLDERLSLVGNSWNVYVISWLLYCLGRNLGLIDDMTLADVAKQCNPGGGLMLTGVLQRPILDRGKRNPTGRTPELTLAQKLGGLVSMKGEDILVQAQTEDTIKHHRLRASLPAKLWKWRTICGWRWSSAGEHINSLELRAVYTSLRWRIMKQKVVKSRFIHMVDSLVCLHSLTRGRSSSKKLRRTLLRINALVLASSCQPVWAYVHTSQNPADKPSRKPVRKRWVK